MHLTQIQCIFVSSSQLWGFYSVGESLSARECRDIHIHHSSLVSLHSDQTNTLKGIVQLIEEFSHYLLILMAFQTCILRWIISFNGINMNLLILRKQNLMYLFIIFIFFNHLKDTHMAGPLMVVSTVGLGWKRMSQRIMLEKSNSSKDWKKQDLWVETIIYWISKMSILIDSRSGSVYF